MRNIVVVGGPGSGKTTVARDLARRLALRHVELDSLWWGPHWTPRDAADFEGGLREIAGTDGWVADGNYFDVGAATILWPAADTLVWLDIRRRVAIARVLRRTTMRALRRCDLWAGNRQSLRDLSPRSVARLVRSWPNYSERVAELLPTVAAGPDVVRIRTRRELTALLRRAELN